MKAAGLHRRRYDAGQQLDIVVLEFSQEQFRRNALKPRFARDAKNRGINSGTLHCLELSPTKLGEHVLDERTDGHAFTKQSQHDLSVTILRAARFQLSYQCRR